MISEKSTYRFTDEIRLRIRNRIKSFAYYYFIASFGLLSSIGAHAAGDGCSFFGALSPQAKALCDAATRAPNTSQSANRQNRESPQPQAGPAELTNTQGAADGNFSSLAPPGPPSPGFSRYEIASGGSLSVDVSGDYPTGYGPAWKLSSRTPQQIVADRYNRLNNGPQGTQTFFVRIIDDQGKAAFEFAPRGAQACIADIVGLPQVLTEAPKRFYLTNFHYAGDRGQQCQRAVTSAEPWQGWIALSANPDGDLKLSLQLEQAMPTGAPWFSFTAHDLPFANQTTAQMAIADFQKKQEIAAANAARAQAAEAAREAEEARIKTLPLASAALSQQVANLVAQDSRGWASSQLVPGSVNDVRVYSGTVPSGRFSLRATYAFNGGNKGWVITQYDAGKFSCIQFWDSVVGCRPLRKPGEGQAMMSSLINGMLNDSAPAKGQGKCWADSKDNNGQPMAGSGCAAAGVRNY